MKTFILLILSPLIIFSCKKKESTPVPVFPPIMRMELTWSQTTGVEKDRIDYSYDNQNRVIGINAYHYIRINGQGSDSIARFEFEYSGNNRLPSYFKYFTAHTGNYFHKPKYDANGRIIEDSVYAYYNQNPIYQTRIFYEYNNDRIIVKDNNGVVVTSLQSSNDNFTYYGPFPNPDQTSQSYEFDTGMNPLNQLNIAPIYFAMSEQMRPSYSFWSVWSLCNKNNLTLIKTNYYQPLGRYMDTMSRLTYQYDQTGLLRERIWFDRLGYSVDTIKYLY